MAFAWRGAERQKGADCSAPLKDSIRRCALCFHVHAHRSEFLFERRSHALQVGDVVAPTLHGVHVALKRFENASKNDTEVNAAPTTEVMAAAQAAKDQGATRFCMGAAWRNPKDRDMPAIVEIVRGVRAMGLETCMTLGMLTPRQAEMLAEAGLDYYNHNIDTSPEHYGEIISTRTFQERLDTLEEVRKAGMAVC